MSKAKEREREARLAQITRLFFHQTTLPTPKTPVVVQSSRDTSPQPLAQPQPLYRPTTSVEPAPGVRGRHRSSGIIRPLSPSASLHGRSVTFVLYFSCATTRLACHRVISYCFPYSQDDLIRLEAIQKGLLLLHPIYSSLINRISTHPGGAGSQPRLRSPPHPGYLLQPPSSAAVESPFDPVFISSFRPIQRCNTKPCRAHHVRE